MLNCEGLIRVGPSGMSSASVGSSAASETMTKKRKCPATVTSGKKKARRWSVCHFYIMPPPSD